MEGRSRNLPKVRNESPQFPATQQPSPVHPLSVVLALQAEGGNLVSQCQQKGSRVGNFSQPASQGNLPQFSRSLHPFPAEGSFNSVWNSGAHQVCGAAPAANPFTQQASSSNKRKQVEVAMIHGPQAVGDRNAPENRHMHSDEFPKSEVTNGVYDPIYEVIGKPVDPHMRMYDEILALEGNGNP